MTAGSASAQGAYFVDPAGGAPNNGLSWATAFSDLEVALASVPTGSFVLVGHGTYKPTTPASTPATGPRDATFLLTNGVRLRGGFQGLSFGPGGGSINPAMPDGNVEETILSGDIGVTGDVNDNCYSVVTVESLPFFALAHELSRFTISGGYANENLMDCISDLGEGEPSNSGAAVYCGVKGTEDTTGGALEISECRFIRNFAAQMGGAVYFASSSGDHHFGVKECSFFNNAAGRRGGALMVHAAGSFAGVPRLDSFDLNACWIYNNLFSGNSAGGRDLTTCANQGGGAIYFGGLSPIAPGSLPIAVANNVVVNNLARGKGAAYFIAGSSGETITICNDTHGGNVVATTDAPGNVGGDIWCSSIQDLPGFSITNSVIYDNDDVALGAALQGPGFATITVSYSDIEVPIVGSVYPGLGNINVNPFYVNLLAGDLSLSATSACIDVGSDVLLIDDHADLDRDMNSTVPIPRHFTVAESRIVDFGPIGPGSCGTGATGCGLIDMGAFERR